MYIRPSERKTILFISDDIRIPSGVGIMSRNIIFRTADHFNWIQMACSITAKAGSVLDMSEEVNRTMGYKDASVRLIETPIYNGEEFGSVKDLNNVLSQNKDIAAIFFFSDPRFYLWLFDYAPTLKKRIPLIYYNIWDNLPYPIWNKPYYDVCDGLFAISKQTYNINTQLLQDSIDEHIIKYIPHGIENVYYPIPKDAECLKETFNSIYPVNKPNFILFFNSVNIQRKNIIDLILAWNVFTSKLSEQDAGNCCLLMHCNITNDAGTNLESVWRDNCDSRKSRIVFINGNISYTDMNYLYNISDGVILPSTAEGWGLSVTEAMMTGKMFIATVTGGIQDQMRFEDENGNWINFTRDFPTNSIGKYKKHGEWCIPVFPVTAHCIGTPITPYVYEDITTIDDIANAIYELYKMSPEERDERGMVGYDWANSEEAGFTARDMGDKIAEGIDEVLSRFKPQVVAQSSDVSKLNSNIIWSKN